METKRNRYSLEHEVIVVTVALYMMICGVVLSEHFYWIINDPEAPAVSLLPPQIDVVEMPVTPAPTPVPAKAKSK